MVKLKSYSKKQLRVINKYWKILEEMTSDYYVNVDLCQGMMGCEAGIYDLEFFKGEGQGFVGVGNVRRTYKLWQKK